MENEPEQIREQQRNSGNRFPSGWNKWGGLFMDFLRPMRDEIIRLLDLKSSDIVLDVAAGTGEPGFTIASNLNDGKAILTDIAEGMLSIARENAMRRQILNTETRVCDICDLPFADNSFNAISCRFGFMFFPDMLQAAREMVRVLKPGGRIVTSVWNAPEKNFWATSIMGTINKHIPLAAPLPDAPGMFRCADKNLVPGLFRQAGLKNITVTEIAGKINCRTADIYWNVMTELGAPIVAALNKADESTKKMITKEVDRMVSEKYGEGSVFIDSSALIIYAEKKKQNSLN